MLFSNNFINVKFEFSSKKLQKKAVLDFFLPQEPLEKTASEAFMFKTHNMILETLYKGYLRLTKSCFKINKTGFFR